jgi:hypothetical protein
MGSNSCHHQPISNQRFADSKLNNITYINSCPSSTFNLSIAADALQQNPKSMRSGCATTAPHPHSIGDDGNRTRDLPQILLCFTKAVPEEQKNTIHKDIAYFEKRDDVSLFLFDTLSPKNIFQSANNDGTFDINYLYTSPKPQTE